MGQLPPNTHEVVPAPAPPPASALIFDSFGRRGQNFVWQLVPNLGKTEAGSLGRQDWMATSVGPQEMPAPFGIINGRAVFLERQIALAWVDAQTTDQDVRIDRFRAGWGHGTTGVAFRVVDAMNWGYLFADRPAPSTPTARNRCTWGASSTVYRRPTRSWCCPSPTGRGCGWSPRRTR